MTPYKPEMASKMPSPIDHREEEGDDGSSLSTDDFKLEPKEEVSSKEEEMNLLAGFEEKLLIRRGRSDDGDTSDSKNNGPSKIVGTLSMMKKSSSPTMGAPSI
jgi:hypothetical protein